MDNHKHYNRKENLFGITIELLLNRESVFLSSLPGMGMNHFTHDIQTYMVKEKGYLSVDIYPHEESNILTNKNIENVIIKKSGLHHTKMGMNYLLEKQNKRMMITIHKLNMFDDINGVLKIINSLKLSTNKNISILIDSDIEILTKQDDLLLQSVPYLYFYAGLEKGYNLFMDEISSRYRLGILSASIKKDIYKKTYGNSGLIISILKYMSNNPYSKVPNNKDLLRQHNILKRITEIITSLRNVQIFDLKDHTSKDAQFLIEIGILKNNKIPTLFNEYYKTYGPSNLVVTNSLTKSETVIYSELIKSHINSPLTVKMITDKLSAGKPYTITEWTAYKHLENLRKKTKLFGIVINCNRGGGYYLEKKYRVILSNKSIKAQA